MPITEVVVTSLGDLIDKVTPTEPDARTGRRRDSGVYRGDADARWPLMTSLDKLGGPERPHSKADLEEHILRKFHPLLSSPSGTSAGERMGGAGDSPTPWAPDPAPGLDLLTTSGGAFCDAYQRAGLGPSDLAARLEEGSPILRVTGTGPAHSGSGREAGERRPTHALGLILRSERETVRLHAGATIVEPTDRRAVVHLHPVLRQTSVVRPISRAAWAWLGVDQIHHSRNRNRPLP